MSTTSLPLSKELLFTLFFAALWLFVSTMLCWESGYRQLRKQHPPLDEPLEQSFWMISGWLGGVRMSNSLLVGWGEKGVHLAPFVLFRLTSPRGVPCIPWEDLQSLGASSGFRLLGSQQEFEVRSTRLRFSLAGKAGVELAQRLGTRGTRS